MDRYQQLILALMQIQQKILLLMEDLKDESETNLK
jgi:hypothetical protein